MLLSFNVIFLFGLIRLVFIFNFSSTGNRMHSYTTLISSLYKFLILFITLDLLSKNQSFLLIFIILFSHFIFYLFFSWTILEDNVFWLLMCLIFNFVWLVKQQFLLKIIVQHFTTNHVWFQLMRASLFWYYGRILK